MSGTDRRALAAEKLSRAFERFEEAATAPANDKERDGAIQRFEICFELLWKATKVALEFEGVRTASPRQAIKEGARRGLLQDPEGLLDMLADRNETAHVYDEQRIAEIFERIVARWLPLARVNVAALCAHSASDP